MENKMERAILSAMVISGVMLSCVSFAKIQNGLYFGAAGGKGGMETSHVSKNNVYGKEDLRGWIVRGHIGYLFGEKNVKNGIEFGYAQYADNVYENRNVGGVDNFRYKGHYFDLDYVFKYGFGSSGWNLLGKAGVAYTYQATRTTDRFYKPYEKDQFRWCPKVGVGFGYEFHNGIAVDLSYHYLFGRKPARLAQPVSADRLNRVASVTGVMLGLSYHIPMPQSQPLLKGKELK